MRDLGEDTEQKLIYLDEVAVAYDPLITNGIAI